MADPVTIGVTIALNAASMALTAMQEFDGPRLDSLKVTNADYGAPVQRFVGTRMLDGLSCIFAEDLKEVEHQNKTKGGKYNQWKYFGTAAYLVAGNPSDAILMVLFDEHVVYDATGAGPLSPFSVNEGGSITDYMRFYLGAADQMPDPRMQATIEALHGPGSCPAYRDCTLIMIEDLPLEKIGNRLPQVKVLTTRNGGPAFPAVTVDSPIAQPSNNAGMTFSPDGERFMYGHSGNFALWDVAAKSLIASGDLPGDADGDPSTFGIDRMGRVYALNNSGEIMVYTPDITGIEALIDLGASNANDVIVKSLGPGYPEYLIAYRGTTAGFYRSPKTGMPPVLDGIELTPIAASTYVAGPVLIISSFVDDFGDLWLVACERTISFTTTECHFIRCTMFGASGYPLFRTVSGLNAVFAPTPASCFYNGKVIFSWEGALYLADIKTGAVEATNVGYGPSFITSVQQIENLKPGSSTLWLDGNEVSLTDLSLIRTVDVGDWGEGDSSGIIFDRVSHALITAPQFEQEITWRYLDRGAGDGVTLQSIVEEVAAECGLDVANEIDASALDQVVLGYSWVPGTGRAILEPLLERYASLVRPHDFKLQFIKRGGSGSGEIPVADMGAGGGLRYMITRTLDSDLPRRAASTFADTSINQQPNTSISQRNALAVDGQRELSLDLSTLADTADANRAALDAYLRRTWLNAETYKNAVTRKYTALEPGDHKSLNFDGTPKTAELTSLTFRANGVLDLDWRRDVAKVFVSPTQPGAPADGISPPVITVFPISKGFVLDIPLVTDVDNGTNPILYFGAGPYTDGAFPGALILQSPDGVDYATEFAAVTSSDVLTWGYANAALGDALATVWDRGRSVSVTVKSGSLTSATEAAIDANTRLNQALLGDEILQFATATLVSSDTSGKVYTLSGFKRGRRGTEVFTGTHVSGEQFVLLDQVGDEEMGASDIGDSLYFKAVTQGRSIAGAFTIPLTYAANSHKPYAPAHFAAVKNPSSGDWVFTWRRRSRIGYLWTGGSTVPLGESTEAYEVDIMNGASVVRTISASTQTATWTAAQQTTDFGSGQSAVTAHVRQIGALVDGRETVGSF